MRFLGRLSIKPKLILMLLAVSIGSIAVVGHFAYSSGQSALTRRIFDQLTSLRASKASQVETSFERIRHHAATLAADRMMIDVVQEFTAAFRQLGERPIPAEWDERLDAYYRDEFFPRLVENVGGRPLLERYRPRGAASRYLQYHYIAANPNPVGEKHFLDRATGASEYGALHARYHPTLRDLVERFGYYDLFLVEPESGFIVYSVHKETDFATSLETGLNRHSKLALAVAAAVRAASPGFVKIVDFGPYRPSYGAPAAFIASPILEDSRCVGVLAFQLPVDEINGIMTGNRNWRRDGLGETGETYLVGQDYLMRSISRFLVEDPENYFATLRGLGMLERRIGRIEQLGTSIMQQDVRTEAVDEALAGRSGTRVIRDYRDVPVLSSYQLLHIAGLRWVIVSEIDLAEAYAPIHTFGRRVLTTTVVLVVLVTLGAMVMANRFVRPIQALVAGAHKISAGETDVVIDLDPHDEFGELAASFNTMVGSLRAQTERMRETNRENEQLLLNILPGPVARRLKGGEENIADSVPNVTVLFADVVGFTDLSTTVDADEAVHVLNDLVSAFDEAAERHGVEKVRTIGSVYMAVSGLSVPRLDHSQCVIGFALEMLGIVHRFNRQHETDLKLSTGVNSGPVVAGIVGRSKFIYDLWGDTVNIASYMQLEADSRPDTILVSQSVHEQLGDLYAFEACGEIEIKGKGRRAVWRLEPDGSAPAARKG